MAQIGAVIGPEFTYELSPPSRIGQKPIYGARWIASSTQGSFSARAATRRGHILVQACTRAGHVVLSALRARRRELHGSIARAIAGLFPETAAARPELLAQHYAQGGLIREAVDSWSEAGRQAIAASAMTEARAHLAHALALAAEMPPGPARQLYQAELQLTLGNVEMATHGFGSPEHGAAFAAAAELCRALPLTEPRRARLAARALYGDWSYKLGKGDFAANLLVGEDLLRLGRERDDRDLRLFTAHTYGSSCMFVGRLVEAWSVFTEALPANCGGGSEFADSGFRPRCRSHIQRPVLAHARLHGVSRAGRFPGPSEPNAGARANPSPVPRRVTGECVNDPSGSSAMSFPYRECPAMS